MKLKAARTAYAVKQVVYTDMPIALFGDEPHKEAPIRPCYILEYPEDKYARVIVTDGERYAFDIIKTGYLHYTQKRSE